MPKQSDKQPIFLYFSDYQKALHWTGERVFSRLQPKRFPSLSRYTQSKIPNWLRYQSKQSFIKEFVKDSTKKTSPEVRKNLLRRDFNRVRIYIPPASANFPQNTHIRKIKKKFLYPWTEQDKPYGQDDLGGVVTEMATLPAKISKARIPFCFFDDLENRCNVVFETFVDGSWRVGYSKNNDQYDRREIATLYSSEFYEPSIDDSYISNDGQRKSTKDALKELQDKFFACLNSKNLSKELEDIFIIDSQNQIRLNDEVLQRYNFKNNKQPLASNHIYQFSIDDSPTYISHNFSAHKNRSHYASYIFRHLVAGAGTGGTVGFFAGVFTFGLGFIISLAAGAVIGAILGTYRAYTHPLLPDKVPEKFLPLKDRGPELPNSNHSNVIDSFPNEDVSFDFSTPTIHSGLKNGRKKQEDIFHQPDELTIENNQLVPLKISRSTLPSSVSHENLFRQKTKREASATLKTTPSLRRSLSQEW